MRTGTLLLARDDDEARELERQLAFRDSLGLTIERLRAERGARARAGAGADDAPGAGSARRPLGRSAAACSRALRVACRRRACGCASTHAWCGSCSTRRAHRRGARGAAPATASGCAAEQVVLAAGAWSGEIGGLPAHAGVPVRPVKGQILRLRDPAGPGLLDRVVRFEGGYLVPRGGRPLRARRDGRGARLRARADGRRGL